MDYQTRRQLERALMIPSACTACLVVIALVFGRGNDQKGHPDTALPTADTVSPAAADTSQSFTGRMQKP